MVKTQETYKLQVPVCCGCSAVMPGSTVTNVSDLLVNPLSCLRLCSCPRSVNRLFSWEALKQPNPTPIMMICREGISLSPSLPPSRAHHVSIATVPTGPPYRLWISALPVNKRVVGGSQCRRALCSFVRSRNSALSLSLSGLFTSQACCCCVSACAIKHTEH